MYTPIQYISSGLNHQEPNLGPLLDAERQVEFGDSSIKYSMCKN